MKIAETILVQLGGTKFLAMTGAKNLVALEDGLMFMLPRGTKNKANKVRITLDRYDTYQVEFMKIRGVDLKTISTHKNIYCDMLQELFTRETGLETRL